MEPDHSHSYRANRRETGGLPVSRWGIDCVVLHGSAWINRFSGFLASLRLPRLTFAASSGAGGAVAKVSQFQFYLYPFAHHKQQQKQKRKLM